MPILGEFNQDCHVCFSISIGEEKQTGNYTSQMLKEIQENPKIKRVTLLKASTLQRYNIEIKEGLSPEEAEEQSKKRAVKWEEVDNDVCIKELKKSGKLEAIKDWDDYRLSPQFSDYLQKVKALYEENRNFRRTVNSTVNFFYNKINADVKKHRSESFIKEKLRGYLMEECAVLVLITNENIYDYEIYPGERNRAMEVAYNKLSSANKMIARPITLLSDANLKQDQAQLISHDDVSNCKVNVIIQEKSVSLFSIFNSNNQQPIEDSYKREHSQSI